MTRVVPLLLLLTVLAAPVHSTAVRDRVWYGPNPGSLDLRRMFEAPDEWVHTRGMIDVFRFVQQHTAAIPDSIVGPNTYNGLVSVDAFRKLRQWGVRTALEVGSVKEQYCSEDDSGMNTSITETLNAIAAVRDAGGLVHYLAMDEPFLSGRLPRCGASMVRTAERLLAYYTGVRRIHPRLPIGMIEAYPSFTAEQFGEMLVLMRDRGILPAFIHVDVDLRAVNPARGFDLVRDLRRIQAICREHRLPFGVIIWGYDGNADVLFAHDAARLAAWFREAFANPTPLPDQFVFYSWSESITGLRIVPWNLPEDRPHTLTNLTWSLFRRFTGTSVSTGERAVPRR